MFKAIKPIKQTTGVYRTPGTVKGTNRFALPCELVDGYAWVYEDKDGPYSKLIWERRAPTKIEAFECGVRCAQNGQEFDDGYYISEELSEAWSDGYKSVK